MCPTSALRTDQVMLKHHSCKVQHAKAGDAKGDAAASVRQDHEIDETDRQTHESRRDVNGGKSAPAHTQSYGKENGTVRMKPVEPPGKRPKGMTMKLGPGSYTLQPRLQVRDVDVAVLLVR
jgi:hypothetical protein